MTEKDKKAALIFVYNADGGIFNLLTDVAHKIFSPQTYACNLCAITHSNFGMKEEWKEFLKTLDNPLEFLHADEFKKKYQLEELALPAVFSLENGNLNLIASAEKINGFTSIEELKNYILLKINRD